MINATELANAVSAFLRSEVEAVSENGRTQILLPVEYPDCDAVSVTVERLENGDYAVSDRARGDAYLVGFLGGRAAAERAERIAERFDVSFVDGRVISSVSGLSVPEVCWRVAQASAAIAEGTSFVTPVPTGRKTFADIVTSRVRQLPVTVKTEVPVEGASGHSHRASILIEETESILEPISGRKAWERATKVYAQFGDLRTTNGFRLFAVLDDSGGSVLEQQRLLSQVSQVGSWSKADEWLQAVVT